MWSDFNEANRDAMLKSELISWPVTLAILVLAFGSLVAAGLPLMLTIVGLIASAGVLYLGTADLADLDLGDELRADVRAGARHRLRPVHRDALPQRALRPGHCAPAEAVATTMDTAGKAVLFSGLTVLISLSAVMLVPSPAFRSMSLGIMVSVLFVLAATLTLLPAVLAKLGPRVDTLALPWVHSGEHRSPALRPLGRAALAPARCCSAASPCVVLLALALPGARSEDRDAVDQGRARRATPRGRATADHRPPSARAPRAHCRSSRRARSGAGVVSDAARAIRASPRCCPPQPGAAGLVLIRGDPDQRPRRAPTLGDDRRPAARRAAARQRWSAARRPRTTTSRPPSRRRRRS